MKNTLQEIKRLQKIAGILQEREEEVGQEHFPKFERYIESLIPKNKRVAFFIENNKLMIGYFREGALTSETSKSLPQDVKDELRKKFAGTNFTFIGEFIKLDPLSSGKKIPYSAVSANTQKDLLGIEELF